MVGKPEVCFGDPGGCRIPEPSKLAGFQTDTNPLGSLLPIEEPAASVEMVGLGTATTTPEAAKEEEKEKEDNDEDTEDMDDEEEELQLDEKNFTEIDFEGVDYLEDEDSGEIYSTSHELVGKWTEDCDDIIWSNESFRLSHESMTD